MRHELAAELELALGRFLLRRNRGELVAAALAQAPAGVDASTYPVLSGLGRLGAVSAAELAAEVGLDRSVTSRYADRLVDAGLVRRRSDPDDRRATLLVLTARGQRAVDQLRASLRDHLVDRTATLSENDLRVLVRGLGVLSAAVE